MTLIEIIYTIGIIVSLLSATLFSRRKWDGLLQWILVWQNITIATIMTSRVLEKLGIISITLVDAFAGLLLVFVQSALCWFLWKRTTLPLSNEKLNKLKLKIKQEEQNKEEA